MKKAMLFLISFLLIFSLCACSGTTPPPAQNNSNNSIDENTGNNTDALDINKEWAEDNTLKILTIGNSFSNNTMKYVYEIATACGVEKVYLGNLYIGGCTLDQHIDNAKNDNAAYTYYYNENGIWLEKENFKLSDAIKEQNWDYISMQQASSSSDTPETYANLQVLIDYVKQNADSNSKLIWNMTWAYDRSKNSRQVVMYKNIVSSVQSEVVTKNAFEYIIPCGTAIQNARTSELGDKMTDDGMHLNTFGQYTAGLTLVHTLTNLPIDNISFSAGLNTTKKQIAINAVNAAVNTPYEITELDK